LPHHQLRIEFIEHILQYLQACCNRLIQLNLLTLYSYSIWCYLRIAWLQACLVVSAKEFLKPVFMSGSIVE